MKKLFTLTLFFLFGIGFSNAEKTEDDRRYRNYTNNFIFNQEGIEFAVFPDGQFDFNYLQDRNGANVFINIGNVQVSFNTGYDYNRFVQYDTYGAVIQIEQIPVFYDSYGRVNQIGNVTIFYNNGFINRIGNLNVFYSRPGIIDHHNGYINSFNRYYVYQPWHNYYSVPFANRCIVYNNAYRNSYFPIRYSWNYHRNYWNTPTYYNGFYSRANVGRNFYRPYERVNYRSFERGRRNASGRAVAVNNRVSRSRENISTGRSQVTRNDRGRSVASTTRTSGRNTTAVQTRSTSRNVRNNEALSTRSNRTVTDTPRTLRSSSNSTTARIGNRTADRTVTTRSNRSIRNTTATVVRNRENRTERATPARSNSTTSPSRSNAATRSAPRNHAAASSRVSSSRNTQARSSKVSSSRNTEARSTKSNSANKKASRGSNSRSNKRG
jgi:hypothetical protein